MIRYSLEGVFGVRVPITHPVQAARQNRRIVHPTGQFQCSLKIITGLVIVARGPQFSQVKQGAPFHAALAGSVGNL